MVRSPYVAGLILDILYTYSYIWTSARPRLKVDFFLAIVTSLECIHIIMDNSIYTVKLLGS